MHEVVAEIERGLEAGVYYLALFTALSIPDICGAIDSTDGEASQASYARWFDRYVAHKHQGRLTGEDCYHFRCGLLHQGTLHPQSKRRRPRYERIIFSDPHVATFLESKAVNGTLNIDVRFFCYDVVAGVRTWLEEVESTPLYRANVEKCIRFQRNPHGGLSFVG